MVMTFEELTTTCGFEPWENYLTAIRIPVYEAILLTIYGVRPVRQFFRSRIFHNHLEVLHSAIEMCPIIPSKRRRRNFPGFVIVGFLGVPQLLS